MQIASLKPKYKNVKSCTFLSPKLTHFYTGWKKSKNIFIIMIRPYLSGINLFLKDFELFKVWQNNHQNAIKFFLLGSSINMINFFIEKLKKIAKLFFLGFLRVKWQI